LADRVRRLPPAGLRDPEKYWRDKSEIASGLRHVAINTERGAAP